MTIVLELRGLAWTFLGAVPGSEKSKLLILFQILKLQLEER